MRPLSSTQAELQDEYLGYCGAMLAIRTTLPPLLGFSGDEGSELLGIERHRHRAEIGEPRLDRRLREHGADLAIEACDDGRRRTLGRAHAGPGPCLVSWQRLGNRRHIRQRLEAPPAGDRERTQRAPVPTCGSEVTITSKPICTWPASRSVIMDAPPR